MSEFDNRQEFSSKESQPHFVIVFSIKEGEISSTNNKLTLIPIDKHEISTVRQAIEIGKCINKQKFNASCSQADRSKRIMFMILK